MGHYQRGKNQYVPPRTLNEPVPRRQVERLACALKVFDAHDAEAHGAAFVQILGRQSQVPVMSEYTAI